MRKTFWDKRIPSLLGLFFLAISVGIVSWFGKNYTQIRSKASVGGAPKQVKISNITDTSFTVSFTTDDRVAGVISYGRDTKLGQVGFDGTDSAGKLSARQVHYIIISGLDPDTKYYFSVQSGGAEFLNNQKPYEATTAKPLLESAPNQISVRGSVNLPDGTIPMDGIVYLSTSTSQLLSTPLKSDGTYLLPISSLLTSDLTNYLTLDSDTIMQLTILNANSESHVSVKVVSVDPIPMVTLSKDYDFSIDTSFSNFQASQSATASPSGALSPGNLSSGFPSFSGSAASGPDIITPKDADKFIDQQPVFRGTAASPFAIVVITIESTQDIQTSVKADNFGNWQFRPPSPLSPGQHIITIRTLDASGIEQTIKRSFTVFAEGSQFTEPSVSPTFGPTPTASASSTPTPTKPGPTATPFPTSLPTVTPTLAQTFTPTPTVLPTISVTISPTSRPTFPSISPPGSSSLFLTGALAALSLTAGFMLFFLL